MSDNVGQHPQHHSSLIRHSNFYNVTAGFCPAIGIQSTSQRKLGSALKGGKYLLNSPVFIFSFCL